MTTLRRYLPTGATRAIYTDTLRRYFKHEYRTRASLVSAINEGPNAGRFYVDFEPLATALGAPQFRCCLPETFETYGEAVAAEVEYLRRMWVLA